MRPVRAKEFMNIIAKLGPAFIKAGQALSSRPDLLPPEYLKELQKLQDRLPPFPNDLAYDLIESELNVKITDVFERLDPEPVAAASIGQVCSLSPPRSLPPPLFGGVSCFWEKRLLPAC